MTGPLDQGYTRGREPGDHLGERQRRDEAQVERPRDRGRRLGLELAALLVQVDLLRAELERHAAFAEALERHAEHARVEIDAFARARGGEDDVVEMVDHRRRSEPKCGAARYFTAPTM